MDTTYPSMWRAMMYTWMVAMLGLEQPPAAAEVTTLAVLALGQDGENRRVAANSDSKAAPEQDQPFTDAAMHAHHERTDPADSDWDLLGVQALDEPVIVDAEGETDSSGSDWDDFLIFEMDMEEEDEVVSHPADSVFLPSTSQVHALPAPLPHTENKALRYLLGPVPEHELTTQAWVAKMDMVTPPSPLMVTPPCAPRRLDPVKALPLEIVAFIVSKLPVSDWINASGVSRGWMTVLRSREFRLTLKSMTDGQDVLVDPLVLVQPGPTDVQPTIREILTRLAAKVALIVVESLQKLCMWCSSR